MKKSLLRAFTVTVALAATTALFAEETATSTPPAPSAEDLAKHGEYLVNNVGMCGDCHSPRGKGGVFIKGKELSGTTLDFKPTVPMPVWAPTAPSLRSLPNYTDEQAVKLLTEGIARTGTPLRPPMPPFRLNENDAKAVIAYLRTLPPVE